MKRSPRLDLPHVVLSRSSRNLPAQIIEALRRAIACGQLPPGRRLPASRVLARTLGVSRNTVLAAYESLASDGLLVARVGSGTRVSAQCQVLAQLAFSGTSRRVQLLREAGFPVQPRDFRDPDGNALYLHG
jgi:DNA-binding FadR family transcriptional regulator